MTTYNKYFDNANDCREIWNSFTDTFDKIYNEKVFDTSQDYQKMQGAINDLRQYFASLDDDVIQESTNKVFSLLFGHTDYIVSTINAVKPLKFQADIPDFTGVNFSKVASSEGNCDCSCHNNSSDGNDSGKDDGNQNPSIPSNAWSLATYGANIAEWVSDVLKHGTSSQVFGILGSAFGDLGTWSYLDDAKKAVNNTFGDDYEKEFNGYLDQLNGQHGMRPPTGSNPPGGDNPPNGNTQCKPGCGCICHDGKPGASTPDGAGTPKMFDPLVLDLNHNGKIDTTNINSGGVYFDIECV